MPKFQTRTYTESIEYVGKLATVPNSNIDSEVALIAYMYKQDIFKVGKDVIRFASKWDRLISKNSVPQEQ
jgi:hypothetical protein